MPVKSWKENANFNQINYFQLNLNVLPWLTIVIHIWRLVRTMETGLTVVNASQIILVMERLVEVEMVLFYYNFIN